MSTTLHSPLSRRARIALATIAFTASTAHAQSICPFETDGASLAKEGLVLTRYALGLRGTALVANTGFAAIDAPTIESTISCANCGLDINGSGTFDTVDATIISRKLAGYQGDALLANLDLSGGTRSTPDAIKSFLLAGCAGSGGIANGGNAFGTPLVLGTTDAQPATLQSGGSAVNLLLPNGNGLRITQSDVIDAPNVVNGSSANALSTGVRGITISGGGVPAAGDPNYGGVGPNRVTDHYGVVAGGANNRAGNDDPVDVSDAAFATVSGGRGNVAAGSHSVVAGGYDNVASGYIAAIGGGETNRALDGWAFIGAGRSNTASGLVSVIGGGQSNIAGGNGGVVGGGFSNNAAGAGGFVGGGTSNTASGTNSTVPGGANNLANGQYAMAAGRKAVASWPGCTVWGDSLNEIVECSGADQFVARARGGVQFITAGTPGAYVGAALMPGATAWTVLSDAASKTRVRAADARSILQKVIEMPINTWQYTHQAADVRHIGPMAQDFYHAFGVGETAKGISTMDADGVALAAIQGLHALMTEKDAKIAALERELAAIKKKLGL